MRAPVNPDNMTSEEQEAARRLFDAGADASRQYVNYENRRRIMAHYVLTHPATVRLQLGLYRLVRDINPLHFALERGWQIGSGREMFTGLQVSRLGAAFEFTVALALVYGIGRVMSVARPQAGSPLPPPRSLTDPIWDLPPQGGGMRIGGRWYSEHALERMAPDTPQVSAQLRARVGTRLERLGITRGHPVYDRVLAKALKKIDARGVPPSVVEAEIVRPGSTNVRVVTAQRGQIVVTSCEGNYRLFIDPRSNDRWSSYPWRSQRRCWSAPVINVLAHLLPVPDTDQHVPAGRDGRTAPRERAVEVWHATSTAGPEESTQSPSAIRSRPPEQKEVLRAGVCLRQRASRLAMVEGNDETGYGFMTAALAVAVSLPA
jgi:hypothetical protein